MFGGSTLAQMGTSPLTGLGWRHGNLRVDAERNRRQLLEAARLVFADRGLDAPLDDIARRAGVGNATLYRRFPSRHDLVAAVFGDMLTQVVAASERAADAPTPGRASPSTSPSCAGCSRRTGPFADLLTTRVAAPGWRRCAAGPWTGSRR